MRAKGMPILVDGKSFYQSRELYDAVNAALCLKGMTIPMLAKHMGTSQPLFYIKLNGNNRCTGSASRAFVEDVIKYLGVDLLHVLYKLRLKHSIRQMNILIKKAEEWSVVDGKQ